MLNIVFSDDDREEVSGLGLQSNLWSPLPLRFLNLLHILNEGIVAIVACRKFDDTEGMDGTGDIFYGGPSLFNGRASYGLVG